MKFDLCTIDWVAISALASFAMVFVTWLSLRQMRRQWREERRPRLNFSIAVNQSWYELKISNLGKENAYNIALNFNAKFIETLTSERRTVFERLQNSPFAIEASCSKYYMICACEDWKKECDVIEIAGKYCNKYVFEESVCIDEYITGSSVFNDNLTNDIGYIKKGLIVQNNSYYPIQKSLDIIAKKISESK